MLNIFKKIIKFVNNFKNDSSIEIIEEATEEASSDLKGLNPELWDSIKVYNRSTGNKKQIYFKNKYICTCSIDEVSTYKKQIFLLLMENHSIDEIKFKIKTLKKAILEIPSF